MYARAQEKMAQLREMARSAAASFAASASSPPARHPSATRPPRWSRNATDRRSEPHAHSTRGPALNDMNLAERLDAAAAAAEILFELRANNPVGGDEGGGGGGTEEGDVLAQLRVVCEDHLNVLMRAVESGGVDNEQLLGRAIEVAEQLVSAIGDDESKVNAAVPTEAEAGPTAAAGPPSVGGINDAVAADALASDIAAVDLMGARQAGGGGHNATAATLPAEPGRPTSREEEEAMIAAAIAASLAEPQPPSTTSEAPTQVSPNPSRQGEGNLIDL